jgi:release factor glutamine methyltransferase
VNPAIREALEKGTQSLRAAGIESARLDARVLLARALGIEPEAMLTSESAGREGLGEFEALIVRRARREPLAYITGTKEFWSMAFQVGTGVLIPRPETETLIEEALRAHPERQAPLEVLDLGTGSGCLLIAFLVNYGRATGVGLDASEAALAYARRNACRHGVVERCSFLNGDWPAAGEATFNVIFANVPYLSQSEVDGSAPEIREHEPKAAISAGSDGLAAIRAIAPVLARQLRKGGLAFVEIGAGQAVAVTPILGYFGLDVGHIASDLSGVPRCLVVGRAEDVAHGPQRNQLEKGH